jgi:hypothetical protein
MPKNEIDYSNTIIYKITCKNKTITDVYVGHTTNFVQRKHAHKQNCINNKTTNYRCKLYEVIRANGGWPNWKMEIINFFKCADHYDARKKEQEYFVALGATLNSIEPLPAPKLLIATAAKPELFCKTCRITCDTLQTFNNHLKTKKHQKKINNEEKEKNAVKFVCDKCDFICCKQSNYANHLDTRKHKNLIKPNIYNSKNAPKIYECSACKKIYKHASTLSAHRKKCINEAIVAASKPNTPEEMHSLSLLVVELVKTNTEMQKQMIELCNKIQPTTNNSYTNIHNKTFNMQFFLNETCKDAMNIMDFVNSMTLEFADLEDVGKLGYVEGISNIIIRKLNELDVHKRPIHCSDAKREIMYVKDDDVWEKENGTYDRIRKAIKYITKKNGDLMLPWSKEHPSCMNTSHPLNDIYIQIMGQSMGGKESFVESENKIMKKIAKAVLINKEGKSE